MASKRPTVGLVMLAACIGAQAAPPTRWQQRAENTPLARASGVRANPPLESAAREIGFGGTYLGDDAAPLVLWSQDNPRQIMRSDLDGSAITGLAPTLGISPGIAIDSVRQKVYWSDDGTIWRMNFDGSSIEPVVAYPSMTPHGIAIDASEAKLYWCARPTFPKIHRCNRDGTQVEDLASEGLSFPYAIALDLNARKVYWTDANTKKIQRTYFDGTGPIEDVLASGLVAPYGLAIDPFAAKFYWIEVHENTVTIRRANLDGSDIEIMLWDFTGPPSAPLGMALDLAERKMYWTNPGRHAIQVAGMDIPAGDTPENRSDIVDLVPGLDEPNAIALFLPGQDRPGACCAGDGSCVVSVQAACLLGQWTAGIGCDSNPCSFVSNAAPLGCRYLRVTPNATANPATPVALRVTSSSHPCLNRYVALDSGVGRLIDFAAYAPPATWGDVAVADSELIPGATYEIRVETATTKSDALSVTLRRWGDVVEPWEQVSFVDIAAAVSCFRQAPGAPALGACDMTPAVPDGVVDFSDISAVVGAFQGATYPFSTPCS